MLELILITSVLGLGLFIDVIASDGDDESAQEFALAQGTLRFEGTDAPEHVTGNELDNLFLGAGGNDLIGSLQGNDTLDGGAGNDRLFAGDGDDIGIGGAGDDRIFLGDGKDSSAPSLGGSEDAGDDFIRGGAGADTLIDTRGSNQIFGDLHNDKLLAVDGLSLDGSYDPGSGESGTSDTIDAGFGNDTLVGDDGDLLTGGPGEDHFVVAVPSDAPGAPAVVTDFDLRDDLFSIVFLETPPADATVTFAFDLTTNVLQAQVGGQEVAILTGLTQADIPFISTFVTTLPDLLADVA